MMMDMSHYNTRFIQSMELCAVLIVLILAAVILTFYGVFMGVTYE